MRVLLMTATIAPRRGTFMLAHADPDARARDYRQSLAFYLDTLARGTFERIVFAENSGAPLDAFRAQVAAAGLADRVDFVSFVSDDDPGQSRFYLELGLLRRALEEPALRGLPDDAMIWKVTGRYIVRNIDRIVASTPAGAEVYVNCRNRPLRWTDFYLAAFTKAALHGMLITAIDRFRTIASGEEILRDIIDEHVPDASIHPRMAHVPHVLGIRGHDAQRYGGLSHAAKYRVRTVVDKLLPRLWI